MIDEACILDSTCPACTGDHDVGEVIDGSARRCGSCGIWLVATAFTDGTMAMLVDESMIRQPWRLAGRKKTRARWRRQGRR